MPRSSRSFSRPMEAVFRDRNPSTVNESAEQERDETTHFYRVLLIAKAATEKVLKLSMNKDTFVLMKKCFSTLMDKNSLVFMNNFFNTVERLKQ
jgi:hypothetical protein